MPHMTNRTNNDVYIIFIFILSDSFLFKYFINLVYVKDR